MDSNTDKRIPKGHLVPSQGIPWISGHFPEVLPPPAYSPGLRDFLEILARGKWVLLVALLLTVLPALIYNLSVKPVYQATAWLEITPYASKVTKFQDVTDPFKDDNEFTATQVMLLQSPALARRLATSLRLEEHPFFSHPEEMSTEEKGILHEITSPVLSFGQRMLIAVKSWLSFDGEVGGPVDPELIELSKAKAFEDYMSSNLHITPSEESNLISIAFDSQDPALARDLVNGLINEFIEWQMDRKIEASKLAKQRLEKQLSVARERLEGTENALNKFANDKGIVSLNSKSNLVYHQLEEINASLAKIESDRIAKEVKYNQARNQDLNTSPSIQSDSLIEDLRNQYLVLYSEYEKLRVRYKDDHPTMKSLKAQVLQVASRINAEQERILNVVKNEYIATLDIERALKTTAEEKQALALKLNNLAGEYKILEREVEVNKQIYESLLERSREIDANAGTDVTNVKVVNLASLPLAPYKPNVVRNVLMAVMLGVALGIFATLVREHLDDSIKRIDEIPKRYWIPVLGVVPMARRGEKKALVSLVRLEPFSAFSESIRKISVSIQHSRSVDNPAKSILLTSSVKGEGKSTLAANLAQSFAISNERVLLIEADMRRPSLSACFSNNGNSRGLSEFLRGTCKYEEVVQNTEIENLYFISAGSIPPSPTELITSQRMKDLMGIAVNHFDRVILDAPPFASDTLALSSQVDRVILVATLLETSREALRVFHEELLFTNAQLLGTIINKFDETRYSAEGFYHRFYRRYEDSYGYPASNLPIQVKSQQEPRTAI